MALNKKIDFRGIKVAKVFYNTSKQYQMLTKMNESVWKKYTTQMLSNKIEVDYDAKNDIFTAKPLKENSMINDPNLLHDDEDQNMDSDVMSIINSIGSDESEEAISEPQPTTIPTVEIEPSAEPFTPPSLGIEDDQTINLSQFEAMLNKVLAGNVSVGTVTDGATAYEIPEEETLMPGSFDNNILDTEFDTNTSNLDYIDSKINAGSYQASIDPSYSQKEVSADEPIDEEGFSYEEEPEFDSEEEFVPQDDDFTGEDEDVEMITEDDDFEEVDTDDDDDAEIGEVDVEDDEDPITANGVANVGGQPVQIILTGVMITPTEVSYIAESAKKVGMKLKAVKGKGKEISFIVESNKKNYEIKFQDVPAYKTKTPFSIKQYNFQTLDEALNKINQKQKSKIREAKVLKTFLTKDMIGRSFSDIKESTILKDFEGKISQDYISGWNVKNVGYVNLKTGINEVYSDITSHSKEANTLMKTKDGQFYLLKGNLKERSIKGIKKQLVDIENKKDFGIGTVVGIYENNVKGLGSIMFQIKRTSIPLLVWK